MPMKVIDENGVEVNIDTKTIDKVTLYLKMEDRKRIDIEYLDGSTNKLCIVIIDSTAKLVDIFTQIGNNIFIKEII